MMQNENGVINPFLLEREKMSNKNQKKNNNYNNNFRTVLNVREYADNYSAYLNGKNDLEEYFAMAALVVKLAEKYGYDVTDVLDQVENNLEIMYENKAFREATPKHIWKKFEEYDGSHNDDNNDDENINIYDCCNLPDDEVPLYIVSYKPEEETLCMRSNVTTDAMNDSIQSIYPVVEMLCEQSGVPMDVVINALYDAYHTQKRIDEKEKVVLS